MPCPPVAADTNTTKFAMTGIAPSVIAFTCGVFFSPPLSSLLPPPVPWIFLAVIAIIILTNSLVRPQKPALILAVPLFFTLGIIRAAPFGDPPGSPEHIYNRIQSRSELTIAGVLTEMPAIPGNRCRITMAAEQLLYPDGKILPAQGLVLLTINGRLPDNIEPGDRLITRATLKRPKNISTPGVFNYSKFLAEKNIWITGWVRSPLLTQKIYQPTKTSTWERLRYLPERLRHKTGLFLKQNLDQQTGSLYRALLLGDRSGVSPTTIENFSITGGIHLLAISGAHMGIIAMLTTILSLWLLKRSTRVLLHLQIRKTAALITLPVLISYALLAGFQTPAIRALVMTTIFLYAILIDRQWSIINNIAIAAFLLLTWNPALIHSASFQLSFTAIIAITLLYRQLIDLFDPAHVINKSIGHKIALWLRAGLGVSLAATLGVMPLLLLHFNRLSILGPISTLLIEPFLCLWALTLGLFACLAIPLSPLMAIKLFNLGSYGLHAALSINSFLATLPFASFRLPSPTPTEIILYYTGLIAFSQRARFKSAIHIAACALLGLAAMFFLGPAMAAQNNLLKVNILDVGQGSATVIELPNNHNILVDGGSYLAAQFDAGERIIAPFLWSRRISKLDAIVISHPHADHYNGLPFILRNFKPKTLWINGSTTTEPGYLNLLQEAKDLGIPIKVPTPKIPIYNDAQITLHTLEETTDIAEKDPLAEEYNPGRSTNQQSLVLRLSYHNISFLLPGDIDSESEQRLIRENKNELDSDVLLAPHHGSGGSLSDNFLEAVSPGYVVVSIGDSHPGGMAEKEAIQKWRQANAKVFTTAESGAVTFTTDGVALTPATIKKPTR